MLYRSFKKGFLGNEGQPLRVTSDFGKRFNPITKKIGIHNGIDIGVPSGTTLRAPIGGIIKKGFEEKGAGLYLQITHRIDDKNFLVIKFFHLSKIDSVVDSLIKNGGLVTPGIIIGKTGGDKKDPNKGSSTGPHLHIEILKNNTVALDPKYWWLSNENLVNGNTGNPIYNKNLDKYEFDSSETISQSSKYYSKSSDITIKTETEFKEKKPPIPKEVESKNAAGIWGITKLIMDSSVKNKQLIDYTISTQQGSLLNFFKKVCQEPLVEFFGDTIGNQYYWIVRRPPFDKEGFKKMMELTMIELEGDSIINTSLGWNQNDIYSWYQYVPYQDFFGSEQTAFQVPSVFFAEFASIWGSKPYCIKPVYYNFAYSNKNLSQDEKNKEETTNIIKNALRDFKYLVESNAYNAFTRSGTITIMGDRRIKRGTLIKHISGEVFYVDSVNNTFETSFSGVNRTTTLQVSRGIYPDYIDGVNINGKLISYFNVIDFGGGFDLEKITIQNWEGFVSKWKVNKNSFGFFMSKQQVYYN